MTDALDASQLPPVVPAMAESRFSVEGLDCYEEVGLLERRLGVLAGVDTVAVDLLSRRLRVTYDPARLSVGDITTTVADAGMRARPESGPADRPPGRGGLWPLGLAGVAFGSGAASAALGATPVVTRTLLAVAIVAAGTLTVRRAVAAVRARRLDIHVLMMVAVLGALLIGEWVEAAAVLVLFALAQELESRSLDRARRAIGRLIELAPDRVLVRRPEGEREVAIDTVRPGDLAIVRPGTKVPVDGRVVEGRSHVDQAALTGESLPVTRVRGDQVFAGTMNGEGALEVEVTRAPEDTTLAQVARLVERAQASRAPSQTFVERFARRYTPAVIALAGALAVVPPLTGFGTLEAWGYRALVLLVIACPCALVIATPVSFVSALAAAARRGVLVKDGAHLERVSQVRCVAFDKTGTLTTGRLRVVSVSPVGATPASVVLEVAASLEARSEHPIAKAICRHAERAGIAWQPATDCRELSGRGMEGRLASSPVLVGSPRLLAERGLASPDVDALVSAAAERGQTPVLIAKDGAAIGVIAVADSVREGGQATVETLRGLGVAHIVLLTGDSEAAGRAIARELNLDSYLADLLPQDKLDAIAEVRGRHGTVIMVGDGVNDAPALAAADVGVAMAVAGTDVALETADVTLMGDELDRLPYLLRLSRATLHVVKSNVAVALGLKLVFLALAVAGAATLWMAVAADMGASLLVIGNGLRLLRTE